MERSPFPDRQQMTATLLRFVFFLGGLVNEKQWHFEQEMEGLHPEDVRVLFLWMEPRRPLMVKEIAHEHRRSFRVAPTEQGQQAVEGFLQQWREVMQGVLEILTPTEQLVLIELLNKLQTNWPSE
jgi:hypothetical protein